MSEQKASRSGDRDVFFEGGKGMLTEQRYEIILGLLREKNSVTVTELKDNPGCIGIYGPQRHHGALQGGEADQGFWRCGSAGTYCQCL